MMLSGPPRSPPPYIAYRPATPITTRHALSSERATLISPSTQSSDIHIARSDDHPPPGPSSITTTAPFIHQPHPTYAIFQSPIPADPTDIGGRPTTSHPHIKHHMQKAQLYRPKPWRIEDGESALMRENICYVLGAVAMLRQPEHHNFSIFWPPLNEHKQETVRRITFALEHGQVTFLPCELPEPPSLLAETATFLAAHHAYRASFKNAMIEWRTSTARSRTTVSSLCEHARPSPAVLDYLDGLSMTDNLVRDCHIVKGIVMETRRIKALKEAKEKEERERREWEARLSTSVNRPLVQVPQPRMGGKGKEKKVAAVTAQKKASTAVAPEKKAKRARAKKVVVENDVAPRRSARLKRDVAEPAPAVAQEPVEEAVEVGDEVVDIEGAVTSAPTDTPEGAQAPVRALSPPPEPAPAPAPARRSARGKKFTPTPVTTSSTSPTQDAATPSVPTLNAASTARRTMKALPRRGDFVIPSATSTVIQADNNKVVASNSTSYARIAIPPHQHVGPDRPGRPGPTATVPKPVITANGKGKAKATAKDPDDGDNEGEVIVNEVVQTAENHSVIFRTNPDWLLKMKIIPLKSAKVAGSIPASDTAPSSVPPAPVQAALLTPAASGSTAPESTLDLSLVAAAIIEERATTSSSKSPASHPEAVPGPSTSPRSTPETLPSTPPRRYSQLESREEAGVLKGIHSPQKASIVAPASEEKDRRKARGRVPATSTVVTTTTAATTRGTKRKRALGHEPSENDVLVDVVGSTEPETGTGEAQVQEPRAKRMRKKSAKARDAEAAIAARGGKASAARKK